MISVLLRTYAILGFFDCFFFCVAQRVRHTAIANYDYHCHMFKRIVFFSLQRKFKCHQFLFCSLHNFNSFVRFNQLFCIQKWKFSHETVTFGCESMGNDVSMQFLCKEGTDTYSCTHLTNPLWLIH